MSHVLYVFLFISLFLLTNAQAVEIYYPDDELKLPITIRAPYDPGVVQHLDASVLPDFQNASDDPDLSLRFINRDPAKVISTLHEQSNDWHEPSKTSEKRYLSAIHNWLDSLNQLQQVKAKQILREYHPEMHALRLAIREKKLQLASLSFDQNTSPETLPRLGQELQNLRKVMSSKLREIESRLRNEAGVPMGPSGYDGYWLVPPDTKTIN